MSGADDRFRRLLLLVPFVLKHEGATVQDLCTRFGISRARLIADLDLLFMCGLPGYGPGDLIEAYIDGDDVVIRLADYFARPLRLTPAEGLMLYTGVKALQALREPVPALEGALGRLTEALGPEALERISVGIESSDELDTVRRGIDEKKRLHLVYQSQAKDELTERDVDPWVVFFSSGRWYLAGWCYRVNDERIFRVDRMKKVDLLATDSRPAELDMAKYESPYVAAPDALGVSFEIAPEASWVLDYYPLISSTPLPDGWIQIRLTAGGTAWLERLLLRLGTGARSVEPSWLGDKVREAACRMAKRYGVAST